MRISQYTYLLCISLLLPHTPVWATDIKNIRIGIKSSFTRIVFDLNKKPDIYNVKYVNSPDRIVINFTEGKINKRAIRNTSAYPLIKKISATQNRKSRFNIEIELAQSASFKHFILKPTKKSSYRLVLDITPGNHKSSDQTQTIIHNKSSRTQNNNVTNFKSDQVNIYDNKVLTDTTLERLFQPFLGNTQLNESFSTRSINQQLQKKTFKIRGRNVPRFNIRGYKVKGNTLLTIDVLKRSVSPFTGVKKSFSDVQHALEALEKSYQQFGYGMVQVYLPEQELDKGIILFKVIEPKISTLKVQGANNFSLNNIKGSITSLIKDKTPNTKEISKNLTLINENPAKKVTVEFLSSDQEGALNTIINVNDKAFTQSSVSIDNTGTDSTGELRLSYSFQHANLTNNDDVLNFQYTTSEKSGALNAYSLGYHFPLYNLNASLDFYAGLSEIDSGIINNIVDVSGKGIVFGAKYNQLLSKKGTYSHRLSYSIDYRNSEFDVIDIANIGIPQVENIPVYPISLYYSGQWTAPGKVSGINFQLLYNAFAGENADADFNELRALAKPDFLVLRFGFEYAQSFAQNWQARISLSGQETSDALITGEQFGIGGATSVRGYDERELTNDKGYHLSAEVYTPSFANSLGMTGDLRALAFYDIGKLTRNFPLPSDGENYSPISSAGIGLRLNYKENLTFKLDLASPMNSTESREKGDIKLHGALNYIF